MEEKLLMQNFQNVISYLVFLGCFRERWNISDIPVFFWQKCWTKRSLTV